MEKKIFQSGKILRVTKNISKNSTSISLGYKEEDMGKKFNIRKELEEKIGNEARDSKILRLITNNKINIMKNNIERLMNDLGYKRIITLKGTNMVGVFEEMQIDLKLMYCDQLKYPLLLEIEKIAKDMEEAIYFENILEKFINKYNLNSRVIKKEPPYLMHRNL